jgi:DNA polymerase-3 subunit gamma/tau
MAKAKTGTAEYTVLARRYRPQQFADLVGQEAVARALVNALESGRVAHAYLFTGRRGVGKTSAARILAKALNCEKGPTATPCDKCDACKAIAGGDDVDVLEIDGASNNSVDDVRELRQNAQYRPSRSRYRIYIIDEVHMLGASAHKSAFNALLKILEEPPAHVKFIFATTEIQKIPATILSRCQRFDFAGIGAPQIVDQLRSIVQAEGLQADDEALERIARRAGGSMRDAQSLLDQLLAFGGDRLTAEQVHQLLGTAQDERVVALASAILQREPQKALELVGQVADEGLQLGELLDQLIDYWRDLMLANCAGDGPSLSVASRHRAALMQQAKAVPLDTILAGLDVLSGTKARLRGSNFGRVLLEMAVVRLARLEDLVPLTQLAQALAGSKPTAEPARPAASRPSPARPAVEDPVKKKPAAAPEPELAAIALTAETLTAAWPEILRQLPPILASQIEKAGLPAIIGPNTLAFQFPPAYNHHRDHCQRPETTGRIADVLRKLTGRTWNLRIDSTGGPAAEKPAEASPVVEAPAVRPRPARTEAEKEPLVKKALDVLGAQVLRVDEGFGAAVVAAEAADEAITEEP